MPLVAILTNKERGINAISAPALSHDRSKFRLRRHRSVVRERRRSGVSPRTAEVDLVRPPGTRLHLMDSSGCGDDPFGSPARRDAADPKLASAYHGPGLTAAAGRPPRSRNRHFATLGAILAQRSRCWYYHLDPPPIACLKRASRFSAREGAPPILWRCVRSRTPASHPHSLDDGRIVNGLGTPRHDTNFRRLSHGPWGCSATLQPAAPPIALRLAKSSKASTRIPCADGEVSILTGARYSAQLSEWHSLVEDRRSFPSSRMGRSRLVRTCSYSHCPVPDSASRTCRKVLGVREHCPDAAANHLQGAVAQSTTWRKPLAP